MSNSISPEGIIRSRRYCVSADRHHSRQPSNELFSPVPRSTVIAHQMQQLLHLRITMKLSRTSKSNLSRPMGMAGEWWLPPTNRDRCRRPTAPGYFSLSTAQIRVADNECPRRYHCRQRGCHSRAQVVLRRSHGPCVVPDLRFGASLSIKFTTDLLCTRGKTANLIAYSRGCARKVRIKSTNRAPLCISARKGQLQKQTTR